MMMIFKILLQLQWQLLQLTNGILTTLSGIGPASIADDIIKIQIWHGHLVWTVPLVTMQPIF